MDTKFGLRGTIKPSAPLVGLNESLTLDGLPVTVKEAVLEIGFDDDAKREKAKEIVAQLMDSFSIKNNSKFTIDLNQSWEIKSDGMRNIGLSMTEKIRVTERVVTTTTISKGLKFAVVKSFDSMAFSNHIEFVEKCRKDTTLATAVKHFSEEALDANKAHYGIYKALEALENKLGSRKQLAQLINKPKKYVDEVMQTTNTERHTPDGATRKVIPDEECKQRAQLLIEAYAKTIL